MKRSTQRHFHFDTRSVMLIAAMAVGGMAQAQTPPLPRPTTQSPASPSGANPSSTSPAMGGSTHTGPSAAPVMPGVSPGNSTPNSFDRADANRDGQISAKEAQSLPAIGNRFEQLDKNRDGQLSRDEFNDGSKS